MYNKPDTCKVIGRGAHLRWIHQNECHGYGGTGGLGWGQGPCSVQWSATGQPAPGCAAAACQDSAPEKGSTTQTSLSKSKQVMHVSNVHRTACGSGSLGEPADRIVVTSGAGTSYSNNGLACNFICFIDNSLTALAFHCAFDVQQADGAA